jgi:uncharacterized membrane protein YphA (DoxX/SURF4 family)
MSLKPWQLPLRLATGAFILNSGISKWNADLEHAKQLQGFAGGAYPQLADIPADRFVKLLAAGEIALGTALLVPAVPSFVAGAGLTAFSGSLLGLYWRTPSMHEDGNPRPTTQGVALAKDSWMLGIGLALMIGSFSRRRQRTRPRA